MELEGFKESKLCFASTVSTNVFARMKKKTLYEALGTKRYSKLKDKYVDEYQSNLNQPIGDFLLSLKKQRDENYKDFLNAYGDLTYCKFKLADKSFLEARGIYAFKLNGKLKYIGRCRNTFKSRVNMGYGNISPRNCYLDGQATNCHINHLIYETGSQVTFHVYPLESESEIIEREIELITDFQPDWNIALKSH